MERRREAALLVLALTSGCAGTTRPVKVAEPGKLMVGAAAAAPTGGLMALELGAWGRTGLWSGADFTVGGSVTSPDGDDISMTSGMVELRQRFASAVPERHYLGAAQVELRRFEDPGRVDDQWATDVTLSLLQVRDLREDGRTFIGPRLSYTRGVALERNTGGFGPPAFIDHFPLPGLDPEQMVGLGALIGVEQDLAWMLIGIACDGRLTASAQAVTFGFGVSSYVAF